MEKENEYTTQIKGVNLGPAKITWTKDKVITELGESKIVISKDNMVIESPKIEFIETIKKTTAIDDSNLKCANGTIFDFAPKN